MNSFRTISIFLGSILLLISGLFMGGCAPEKRTSLNQIMTGVDSLVGNPDYLSTPFAAAGDRVYMIGSQNGQFPDLGWHVTGEMGGIWDHPIKLLDGFTAAIRVDQKAYCLSDATTFINFPFANKHIFELKELGIGVGRLQFVPDGKEAVVVEYTFYNKGNVEKRIEFEWTAFTDLRPTWLGERTSMIDSPDRILWDEAQRTWMAKDSLNPWYVTAGAPLEVSASGSTSSCDYQPAGRGAKASMSYAMTIPPNSSVSLPITIAGSYQSLENLKATYSDVQQNAAKYLVAKKARFEALANRTKLTIPDKDVQKAFEWVKYSTDWLIRDVPEVGRGLSAGLPDYPWWFGVDNEYTLQGAIATGHLDLVLSTIELIHSLSEKTNGNGRILHEVSTNGAVFNPGNINETPQFASLIWQVYQWTGDRKFLEKYYPTVKKGLKWLLEENDKDGNLLPDGFGMMEIHGMNSEMVDVAVYTQKAFADAAEMASILGEVEVANQYKLVAEQLRLTINSDFWVPEFNSFADFIGTREQALHLLDDAIVRADTLKKPWAVAELNATRRKIQMLAPGHKQGFVVHHNWVVNTPMEMGIADPEKALIALKTGSKFVNPYGMFVTGIDRDESAGKDVSSFAKGKKTFSYTGAVMTLPTGVQAIAENNYGRPDEALGYLKRITRSFGYALPGSIYEVSPDYGMMTQAWNLYSFAVPIIRQFFGIQPRAFEKTIRIQPQLPTSWPEASLENVLVGDNELSIQFEVKNGQRQITLSQTKPDWEIHLAYPKSKYNQWEVDGKPVRPAVEGDLNVLELTGSRIVVRVK